MSTTVKKKSRHSEKIKSQMRRPKIMTRSNSFSNSSGLRNNHSSSNINSSNAYGANNDDDSSSELDSDALEEFCSESHPSMGSFHREIHTETETVESSFEIRINRCQNVNCPRTVHGPVNLNYSGPIILSPTASLDTILGFLANHLNMSKESLSEAFATSGQSFFEDLQLPTNDNAVRRNNNNQDRRRGSNRQWHQKRHHQRRHRHQSHEPSSTTDATTTTTETTTTTTTTTTNNSGNSRSVPTTPLPIPAAAAATIITDGPAVQEVTRDPNSNSSSNISSSNINSEATAATLISGASDSSSSFPTIVDITSDEDGNLRIMVKMKKTVRHKVVKVVEEDGHVMAKACILTIICAVFIIVAWVILESSAVWDK